MWKKRLNYILSSVIMFAFVQGSHARLFETVEECDARYGEPVESNAIDGDTESRTYAKDNFLVAAILKSNKASSIYYQKFCEGVILNQFDQDEVEILKNKNSDRGDWIEVSYNLDDYGIKYFKRSDGEAFCTYNYAVFLSAHNSSGNSITEKKLLEYMKADIKVGSIYSIEFHNKEMFGAALTILRGLTDKRMADF